jgi:PPM family protein phosphatase
MDAAGGQIQGKRDDQEDAWHVERYGRNEILAVVADGLGGHPAGDVASRVGIEHFVWHFGRTRKAADSSPRQWLQQAVIAADRELKLRQEKTPELHGMATTMVAFYVHDNAFWAASVGDSYLLLHRRQLIRLNELHSEDGGVTSCMGYNLSRVDIAERLAVEAGDRFMLATDGITTLDDEELRVLLETSEDAESAVSRVLKTIEDGGKPYQDNATVIAVFI